MVKTRILKFLSKNTPKNGVTANFTTIDFKIPSNSVNSDPGKSSQLEMLLTSYIVFGTNKTMFFSILKVPKTYLIFT